MKLRDLARGSSNPTSFMPAFHIFRSRFWNRETARHSRKSPESVSRSSSALRLLTSPQQTTVVPFLSILCPSRHPGSPITFPIRTYHGDRNLRKRKCIRSISSHFLILEQNQRKVYREVLVPGDLSEEDINGALAQPLPFQRYGGNTFGTAAFVYGNDTVHFAQPGPSQLTPGGSGAGAFNESMSTDTTSNAFALTGRNAPKGLTGRILRYAPLLAGNIAWCPDIHPF